MNIPCPNKIVCPPGQGSLGEEFPFANLSSETPDSNPYLGEWYGFAWRFPSLGSNWSTNSCLGMCTSEVSQADADLCAVIANLQCIIPDWGTGATDTAGGGGGGIAQSGPPIIPAPFIRRTVFFNNLQQCNYGCPDGLPFIYQVGAGLIAAPTQQEADAMAFAYACNLARINRLCLSDLTLNACINQAVSSNLTVTGRGPVTFQIVAGALPPGLSLTQTGQKTARISGSPTASGNYSFTVKVQNAAGNFMQKTYTIHVLEITNAGTLPNGTKAAAYSYQFAANGGVAPYVFSGDSTIGIPPAGLSLSASGLLSGTPTANGNYTFGVKVRDAQGAQCSFTCRLMIGSCNVEIHGFAACPGDPSRVASITIPQGTYCEDTQQAADDRASRELFNALQQSLRGQGCACYVTLTESSYTSASSCLPQNQTCKNLIISSTCFVQITTSSGIIPIINVPGGGSANIAQSVDLGLGLCPKLFLGRVTFTPFTFTAPSWVFDFT